MPSLNILTPYFTELKIKNTPFFCGIGVCTCKGGATLFEPCFQHFLL
jgi:hypothetical protein